MSRCVVVLMLLTVSCRCDGHLGRLTDAVLNAHKHVHDTVHNVASSVLGGLTGGFNFNFGAHGGIKPAPGSVEGTDSFQRPPYGQPPYQMPPVEQPVQGNHYDQQHGNQGNYGVQQGQNGNHQYASTPPNQYSERPSNVNTPFQGNYGNNGNVQNQQEVHENDKGNQQGQNANHQDISTPSNQYHDRPSSENKPVHHNGPYQEQDRDVKKPTEIPNDDKKTTPGTATHTNEPVPTDKPHTTKPADDAPLFVPLSPDEYKYEGDKIEVNAPKRDTEKTTPVYDIDIRFRDD
ncbi:hypothetical protein EVAR_31950_1 [Eumeta japonica]|uniref:Uncharacterized protein n=1 Tax=Eumeta variegata TaxID=151549 RepID=A0A4C1VUT9_EUMVA|nr:hypothetical protein EVAR_31950_1 [Eumeta japonica]